MNDSTSAFPDGDEGEYYPLSLAAAMYIRDLAEMGLREKLMTKSALLVQTIDALVRKLVSLPSNQFAITAGSMLTDKEPGRQLLHYLGVARMQGDCFPKATFSPYFELFERHLLRYDFSMIQSNMPGCGLYQKEREGYARRLNTFVGDMRREAHSPQFVKQVESHKAVTRKNQAALVSLLDRSLRDHDAIMVVGLEIGYNVPPLGSRSLIKPVTFAQMKAHRARLLEVVREEWGRECVGSAWALGLETDGVGYNNHMLFFFNQRTQEDGLNIARMLGLYWKYYVTNGRGCFYNCNLHAAHYPYPGMGVIWHDDAVMREEFIRGASFLTMADHFVRLKTRGDNPNFGTSVYKQKRGVLHRKRKVVPAPIVEAMPWRSFGGIIKRPDADQLPDNKSGDLPVQVTPHSVLRRSISR